MSTTAQRIRDLYRAGELRARIPDLIEQMGLPRPSRQAVHSALKRQYARAGRPYSTISDAGLIREIYDAYRRGLSTGMTLTEDLRDAILVAEYRCGQNEQTRMIRARNKIRQKETQDASRQAGKRDQSSRKRRKPKRSGKAGGDPGAGA